MWSGVEVVVRGIDDGSDVATRTSRRHLEFPVRQRRKTAAQLMLQCAVDLGDCKAGAGLGDACDDVAPRVDDHRIAIGFAAVVVRAALRGRQHVAEILDGACTHQQLPVRTARRRGECRWQAEDLRALRLQQAEQLRESARRSKRP